MISNKPRGLLFLLVLSTVGLVLLPRAVAHAQGAAERAITPDLAGVSRVVDGSR